MQIRPPVGLLKVGRNFRCLEGTCLGRISAFTAFINGVLCEVPAVVIHIICVERHFPNLQIIGWIDSSENVSDCAIAQTTANGMMTASHLDQLQQIIHRLCKTMNPSALDTAIPKESDRLKYELSDDEVNALLGVE